MSEMHQSPSNAAASGSLVVTPKAGATVVHIGQHSSIFPMESALDEMGGPGFLARLGLRRIDRNRALAVARAVAESQTQLARGATECQVRELLSLIAKMVEAQGRIAREELKNFEERHLERCIQEALTGRMESLQGLSTRYCEGVVQIEHCQLLQNDSRFSAVQKDLLNDCELLYQRQRQRIRDLNT